jgi:toxin CcdB
MAQFDLYANPDNETNLIYPYFVDIQTRLLDPLHSRVVIPLTPIENKQDGYPASLCPVIDVGGEEFALLTYQIASVSNQVLSHYECSIALRRDDIVAAIDFLVTGV